MSDSTARIATAATALNSAGGALADGVHRLARGAQSEIDSMAVKGERAAAMGAGYLRQHPVLSLGLAVAAGYALSRLLAAR